MDFTSSPVLRTSWYSWTGVYLRRGPMNSFSLTTETHVFIITIILWFLQTRILVTNGLHFLPRVENILVLVDGSISETGSYEQLLSHNGDSCFHYYYYLVVLADQDTSD